MAVAVGVDVYSSVEFSDAYHAAHPFNATGWAAIEVSDKERFKRLATRLFDDLFEWEGYPSQQGQVLSWPRSWVYDSQRRLYSPIPSDVIPVRIKEAESEWAYQLSKKDLTIENEIRDERIIRSGDVQFGRDPPRRVIPSVVLDRIPEEWYCGVKGGGIRYGSIGVERA